MKSAPSASPRKAAAKETGGKTAGGKAAPAEHRFIVLEGPIGVGKTSLATKIAASMGAELVLENADQLSLIHI